MFTSSNAVSQSTLVIAGSTLFGDITIAGVQTLTRRRFRCLVLGLGAMVFWQLYCIRYKIQQKNKIKYVFNYARHGRPPPVYLMILPSTVYRNCNQALRVFRYRDWPVTRPYYRVNSPACNCWH